MAKEDALRDFLTGLEEAIPLLQQTQDVLEDLTSAADTDSKGWSKVWRAPEQVCPLVFSIVRPRVLLRTCGYPLLADCLWYFEQAQNSAAKVSAVTRRKNRQRLAEGLEVLEGQLKTATAWLQPLQGADAK